MNFTDFKLDERLQKGIDAAGYVVCTPVQEQVLAASGDGSDLYVQSQTGTGKTAAYLVSVIQEMLSSASGKKGKALVLVPTRELAVQVEEEAKTLLAATDLVAFSFYGGVGYEKQVAMLRKGVDIIIGTPGRIIDLTEGKHLDLSGACFTVIDEADRMFDMGFYPDLRTILKCLPPAEERQTMLFSATLNSYVKNLAWEYTRDAKEITIEAENITVSEIDQELIHVSSDDKMRLLVGILRRENPSSAIIFCNTKRMCEVVAKRLQMNGFRSEFIIGDLPQAKRLKVLSSFKDGAVSILVATDVAARGIDVDSLAMVINYDLPIEAENYVHRIGRTARAGKTGKAYTFCSEQDVYNLPAIERYVEMQIPAKVAAPEDMDEDKSAGVYIRTQDWRDDYDDSRGGRKTGRNGRMDKGGRGYSSDRSRKGPSAKGGKKGRNRNDGAGKAFSSGDIEKIRNMSFDERMKFYKEKYSAGSGACAPDERRQHSGDGKKKNPSAGRKNSVRTRSAGSSRNEQIRRKVQDGRNNPKTGSCSASRPGCPAAAAPEKKSLMARIKAFFGR